MRRCPALPPIGSLPNVAHSGDDGRDRRVDETPRRNQR